MKLLNAFFLVFVLLYSFCGKSQQSFEQGYFEFDENYTERVKREFEPKITEVKICPGGFNGKNPQEVIQEFLSNPKYDKITIKSLNAVRITFNLLKIYSNGDILHDKANVEFECRLIDIDGKNIIGVKNVEFNLTRLVDENYGLTFTFRNLNNEKIRYKKLTMELRRNNLPVYSRANGYFVLNRFYGKKAGNCFYSK